MFKKAPVLFFLFVTVFRSFCQTGPAGIGTSTNNVLWLKADAGTSSTTNSTAISFWNDQSGNALNVTQTVSAQQPSFAANFMNGFPAVQFDNTNSAGLNDKLIGPDSPLLDNTSGYTFFTVTRPQNLDGTARTIVSKRTGVSVDQSFMLFYYTSNKLNVDIQTTDNRFASNTTYVSGTNYITNLTYDGTVSNSSLRCTLYNEETFDRNAAETSTFVPDNSSPLLLGTTDASDSRPYGGYISEIIIYREALNSVSRIIVNNYLSAKYNIALSANDTYLGDNAANGDYDRDVAGVGKVSPGTQTTFSASVSGGLGLDVTSGLDNGDYIMAGHAVATNMVIFTDVGGMTGTANARWQRVWYLDVTNTSATINTTLEFDMSDGGVGAVIPGTVSNYVLLYRAGQTGNWTELNTASSVSGDKIIFNAITLTNDGYYTIGTRDFSPSPLPVELLAFSATSHGTNVDLSWSTATEKNNNYFSIERSKDGVNFETITKVKGAGNSTMIMDYLETDYAPYPGISYYRLKQTDYDGKSSYSPISSVDLSREVKEMTVFPNPNDGTFKIGLDDKERKEILVVVKDLSGKEYFSKIVACDAHDGTYLIESEGSLVPGSYVIIASSNNRLYNQKLIVK